MEKLINYRAHSILLRIVSLKDGLSENISLEKARGMYSRDESVVTFALSISSQLAKNNFNDLEYWWQNEETNKVTSEPFTLIEYLDNILETELNNHIEKKYGTLNDSINLLMAALIERFLYAEIVNDKYETINS